MAHADPDLKSVTDYDSFDKDLSEKIDKCINVLLLGETGTGKSTFINSLANYSAYDSFDDAERQKLSVPIPATITLWDKHKNKHDCSVGTPNENEVPGVESGVTQDVKTYLLPTEDGRIFRLIDTPGTGDPRGIEFDDRNCENLLSHLSEYETLHAICFLVKSNNSRITILFEYCFKQILCRLHKSASNNIIFIFTFTRGDNYSGGNTYSCLEKLLADIRTQQQVHINFDRNLFFFDNEAFNVLAALQNHVEIDPSMRRNAAESWNQSASEWKRLVSYIRDEIVQPHKLKSSICINEARHLIDNVSKPLAEVTAAIFDNLFVLWQHEQKLVVENQSLDDMKKDLYIPTVNLKTKKLILPNTICMSPNCVEYLEVNGKVVTHYKQVCHEGCGVKYVPALSIGNLKLMTCSAMKLFYCQQCGCSFANHTHVYKLTEKYTDKIEDKNENIKSKEEAMKAKKYLIGQLNKRRDSLEEEQKDITEATVLFAHFLQENAIMPTNDSYKLYINHEIAREKGRGIHANQKVLSRLTDLLQNYEAKNADFEKAVESTSGDYINVTAEDVINRITGLYDLSLFGKTLKELMDVTDKYKGEAHKESLKDIWLGTTDTSNAFKAV